MESREKLPQPVQVDPVTHCKEKDIDDCWFYFTYSVNSNGEAHVHVVETPGRSPGCVALLLTVPCFYSEALPGLWLQEQPVFLSYYLY